MSDRRRIRRVISEVGVLASLGIMLAGAVVLAAECKIFNVNVPDPATLNLTDGDHLIASTNTTFGRFEARVSVRGKIPSETRYSIRGKPMRPTSDEKIPPDLRECLKRSDRVALPSSSGWFALRDAIRSVRDWFETPVAAVSCRTGSVMCVDSGDGIGFCCVSVICSDRSRTSVCADFPR